MRKYRDNIDCIDSNTNSKNVVKDGIFAVIVLIFISFIYAITTIGDKIRLINPSFSNIPFFCFFRKLFLDFSVVFCFLYKAR